MYHSLPNKPNVKWLKVRIVFYYQNLSDLLWEKNVVVIDNFFWYLRLMAENLKMSWDHDNNLFKQWMARTIFGSRILILICSWGFIISNKLEQFKFKLEKKYWNLDTTRKSYKKNWWKSTCSLPLYLLWKVGLFWNDS